MKEYIITFVDFENNQYYCHGQFESLIDCKNFADNVCNCGSFKCYGITLNN